MHPRRLLTRFVPLLLFMLGCPPSATAAPADTNIWRGVHLWLDKDESASALKQTLPALAKLGVNAVVMEVNYSFEFKAHPELRNQTFIHRKTARALAKEAARNNIRLIPEFNCLGHQSFGRRVEPLFRSRT